MKKRKRQEKALHSQDFKILKADHFDSISIYSIYLGLLALTLRNKKLLIE